MVTKSGLVLLVCVSCAGCSGFGDNVRYDGPERPRSEVSVMSLGIQPRYGFKPYSLVEGGMVREIDGSNPTLKSATNNTKPAIYLPGTHQVHIWFRSSFGFNGREVRWRESNADLAWQALPGHSYYIVADRAGEDRAVFSIVDQGVNVPLQCSNPWIIVGQIQDQQCAGFAPLAR